MIFSDRADAGQRLAVLLQHYAHAPKTLVVALPRGGVVVAYEIAKSLHLPLEILLVRKLGVPRQEEYAMGAIAERDICIFNKEVIHALGIAPEAIQVVIQKEQAELQRRIQTYRQGQEMQEVEKHHIILVDDGIATGATTKAAILALHQLMPAKITLAVPIASRASLASLKSLVDEVICIDIPEPFYGVGQGYRSFPQTSDQEVRTLLKKSKENFV